MWPPISASRGLVVEEGALETEGGRDQAKLERILWPTILRCTSLHRRDALHARAISSKALSDRRANTEVPAATHATSFLTLSVCTSCRLVAFGRTFKLDRMTLMAADYTLFASIPHPKYAQGAYVTRIL